MKKFKAVSGRGTEQEIIFEVEIVEKGNDWIEIIVDGHKVDEVQTDDVNEYIAVILEEEGLEVL